MITTREQVYQAVFNQVSTAIGFNSFWRKFVPIQQLTSPQMPALMMRQVKEERQVIHGLPPKYTIDIDLAVICETQSDLSNIVPATYINTLIDAVELTLEPKPSYAYVVTLGMDSISRVWIEGAIEILETIPGSSDRSFALIPIRVVCN